LKIREHAALTNAFHWSRHGGIARRVAVIENIGVERNPSQIKPSVATFSPLDILRPVVER
jgi:hypothetical protein